MAITFYGQSFDGIFFKFGYIPENVSRYYRENRNSIYKNKNVFNIYTNTNLSILPNYKLIYFTKL